MSDFSVEAQRIVEAVVNACYDITEAVKKRDDKPTPFQRAVIGALVIQADAAQSSAYAAEIASGISHAAEHVYESFSSQQISAAFRAIAPFLDETEMG